MKTNRFFNRDIVSIKDFQRHELEYLFEKTDKMKKLNPKEKDEFGKEHLFTWFWTDVWVEENGRWKIRDLRAIN